MAWKIIWSPRAQTDRRAIFTYWNNRNKSTSYSKRLNTLFKEAVALIGQHPEIGKPTDLERTRAKIVRDYLIIYEIKDTQIQILTIWDTRQDPDKLRI
jgi:addiction module RelE/StbE family toxin